MINVLSIDFESWVHRNFLNIKSKKGDCDFIENAAHEILKILKKSGLRITFFVVGQIYEWYPDVIKLIKEHGHEIGYHTHNHTVLKNDEILINEIEKSRHFLKKFRPSGFRAPEIFIKDSHFSILKKNGFTYDSSSYGTVDMIRDIEGVKEIPVTTFPLIRFSDSRMRLPRRLSPGLLVEELPVGSGFFLSMLGSGLSSLIKYCNNSNSPAILFTHPWQVCRAPNYGISRKPFAFKLKQVPYSIERKKSFIKILEKHKFCSFQEFIENDYYV